MNSYNFSAIPGGRADAAVLGSRGMGATPFARPRSVPPPLPARFAMPAADVWQYPPAIAAMPAAAAETPRAYGIGWFGVFVAWLATATLGAAVATSLPAHESARIHATTAAAIARGTLRPVAAVPSAPAAVPAAAPPLFRVSDLPSAPVATSAAHPRSHAQPPVRLAAPEARPVARARATPAEKKTVSEEDGTAAPPERGRNDAGRTSSASPERGRIAEEAAPPAKQSIAAPAVVHPPPAPTFAAGSLEDLIRKEVDKEQRSHKK